ncbi:DUF4190 domain-containing protein [Homoserinimonas hongtaonis]|uniref:DUF4190 domain-containing protein n=1 Tax=Homoserinimonas hongtaonis TaxID=2079791 RepID=UPI000D33A70D|nr:DUF4190 domain-containing protein [Salinibacterium hongtaonis]AWB88253.1 hypothetical protein C2138_00650 [Salinibacterium hongtaonis]
MSDFTPPAVPEAPPAAFTTSPYSAAPAPAPAPSSAKGLAIAALVTGLVSLVTVVFFWLSIACGIAAVVLGIIALVKRQSKGMSITGIVTGAVGIVGSIIAFIVMTLLLTGFTAALAETPRFLEQFAEPGGSSTTETEAETSPGEYELASAAFAAAAPSADEIQFEAYNGEGLVVIYVALDATSLPSDEYRALLEVAAQHPDLQSIEDWIIEGYTFEGDYLDLSASALEAGVPAEFINSYGDVVITSTELVGLFG